MIENIKYPKAYKAINTVEICSNRLVGGGNLIGFDNFPPLLIGQGNVPQIWLYTKIDKFNWAPLVTENTSNHAKVQIDINLEERQIIIKIENTILIRAKMEKEDFCVVDELDLRPVGLNLYGNVAELNVGNSKFNKNTFKGLSFMIGMSENTNSAGANRSYA